MPLKKTKPAKDTKSTEDSKSPEVLFGKLLRKLRMHKGLSQDQLGHDAGYSRNYIGDLERGNKGPSLPTLINLGDALGVRPSELLKQIEQSVRVPKRMR